MAETLPCPECGMTPDQGGCSLCRPDLPYTPFTEERGTVTTDHGVWRPSDDSGIPITVTQPDDPAYRLLTDSFTTTPTVYRRGCFICEDPEFAAMGLPLCRPCPECTKAGREGGHIAADDCVCDECGYDDQPEPPEETG